MSVVGSIAVNVVARTAAFIEGMKKSQKQLMTFDKAVSKTGSALSQFGGLVGAAAGVVAGGSFIAGLKDTAERLDEVAKTADRLGMTTESLMGLQHGAGLAGVEVGMLDKSLQGMTRRVSEAAKGTGDAVGAIEELKLNAYELNRLQPEQMLGKFADALNGVSSESDRVRLATKLFGEEGVKMLNFLSEGSKGIEAYRKEADQLGISMSRENIAKIEEMNDAMSRLGAAWEGVKGEILINIAPAALDAMEVLKNWIQTYKSTAPAGKAGAKQRAMEKQASSESWFQKYYMKPMEEFWVGRQLKSGDRVGGNDAAVIPGNQGAARQHLKNPFTQQQADSILAAANRADFADRERAARKAKATNAFKNWIGKGNDKSFLGKMLGGVSDAAEWALRPDAPGGLGQQLGQYGIFGKLHGLKNQARDFGLKFQRDFMLNKFMGGGGAVGLGAAASMPMGGNDIAERGTQAAYQASKASDHVAKILREQLQIGKQQVEHLAKLVANTGGGDTFSMGSA